MPGNGKWRPYVLKVRRTLAKSWLCPLLVCEQDKVASYKGLVLILKWQWRDLVEKRSVFNTTSLICSLIFQLFQTDETFTVNGRKHTHTDRHTHTHTYSISITSKWQSNEHTAMQQQKYMEKSIYNKVAEISTKKYTDSFRYSESFKSAKVLILWKQLKTKCISFIACHVEKPVLSPSGFRTTKVSCSCF